MTTKTFHIGDILTITTGRLVSPRHVDGIYDILNFMTGDNLFTHQLPRGMDECAPSLRQQFPDLATVQPPEDFAAPGGDVKEGVDRWLAEQVTIYGETREVAPLAADEHTHVDPFSELRRIRPDMPVVAVVVPDGEPPEG